MYVSHQTHYHLLLRLGAAAYRACINSCLVVVNAICTCHADPPAFCAAPGDGLPAAAHAAAAAPATHGHCVRGAVQRRWVAPGHCWHPQAGVLTWSASLPYSLILPCTSSHLEGHMRCCCWYADRATPAMGLWLHDALISFCVCPRISCLHPRISCLHPQLHRLESRSLVCWLA